MFFFNIKPKVIVPYGHNFSCGSNSIKKHSEQDQNVLEIYNPSRKGIFEMAKSLLFWHAYKDESSIPYSITTTTCVSHHFHKCFIIA